MARWWRSPPGRYLLGWEQAHLDAVVDDVFGFHALQLGLAQLDALRANRMPHRWLALPVAAGAGFDDAAHGLGEVDPEAAAPSRDAALEPRHDAPDGRTALPGALCCEFGALPFPNASLDLVVLPHALEFAGDPHDALREVERVLMPEGRVVIVGFNPRSLWGLRQRLARWRLALGFRGRLFLPRSGVFIAPGRVRDWLRLLGFEVESARFGCWRPPLRRERWLRRWAWIDGATARALPGCGAVYAVQAVKRVRGMRLVGLVREAEPRAAAAAPAGVAPRALERCADPGPAGSPPPDNAPARRGVVLRHPHPTTGEPARR